MLIWNQSARSGFDLNPAVHSQGKPTHWDWRVRGSPANTSHTPEDNEGLVYTAYTSFNRLMVIYLSDQIWIANLDAYPL